MPLPISRADAGTTVLLTQKSFEEPNLPATSDQLFQLIATLGRRPLYLDFVKVQWLTSTGLGMLVALLKRVRAVGGRLSLHNLSPMVYEIFEVTQLIKVFDIQRKGAESKAG
jgi:anti-sigma B factor antagonist